MSERGRGLRHHLCCFRPLEEVSDARLRSSNHSKRQALELLYNNMSIKMLSKS